MSDLHIEDVNARVAQFAETINNYRADRPSAGVANGFRLLDASLYTDALRVFSETLESAPGDPNLHFGIALAQLNGVRPHRHASATKQRVVNHLQAACDLPHALILELLVAEDYGLYWRRVRSKAIPAHIKALAARVPPEQAERILRHVPAPEARTWRALAVQRRKGATAS